MTHRGNLAIAALLLAFSAAFWLFYVEPIRRWHQFCNNVHADLESLGKKRPAEFSRHQWNSIVGWTLNAHGNCLIWPSAKAQITPDEMTRFEKELKERLKGPVSLATIDWIWDEIVRLTPGGKHYSDNWRPTRPDRLKDFDRGTEFASWWVD